MPNAEAVMPDTKAPPRRRPLEPARQHREINAGPLAVIIQSDENGRLLSVTLPDKVPAGLTAAHLATVIAALDQHQLATESGPPFHRKVWAKLRTIPAGKTLTYGRIAAALGNPRASRAVGQACGANPLLLTIPCHRVVGVNGLGGFACGLAWKKKLLELEASCPPGR